jgi:catechol 2,3-dioxygenase-like lactoylglutathione lyase family enzyme
VCQGEQLREPFEPQPFSGILATMLSHLVLNVTDLQKSLRFYLSTLGKLGYELADHQSGAYARITNGASLVIVLSPLEARYSEMKYHRKAVGLNHLALAVPTKKDVDNMYEHLVFQGVPLLGQGMPLWSDYRGGYYSIFFEDPDRMMIEIVWHHSHYFSYGQDLHHKS